MAKETKIIYDISWSALLKVAAFLLAVWALVTLREVFILMLVVFIFVAAVNPSISFFQKYMSRSLAVTAFFVLLLLAIAGIMYAIVPAVVHQLKELFDSYPHLAEKIRPYLSDQQINQYSSFFTQLSDSATAGLQKLSTNAPATIASFLGGLVAFITGLAISFYLLLEEKNAKVFFHQVLPRHRFSAVYITVQKISEKMGLWIRGQLVLMLIIGLANFISYLAIGVPTPVPLAIWAGLCEAIPYIGPALGVLPALLILLVNGHFVEAFLVFMISYALIQQVESHFVVPKVMGRAVGLSPVLVILSIITGVKLFGLLGAIIAVPAAAIVSVIIEEWPNLRKTWEQPPLEEEV